MYFVTIGFLYQVLYKTHAKRKSYLFYQAKGKSFWTKINVRYYFWCNVIGYRQFIEFINATQFLTFLVNFFLCSSFLFLLPLITLPSCVICRTVGPLLKVICPVGWYGKVIFVNTSVLSGVSSQLGTPTNSIKARSLP